MKKIFFSIIILLSSISFVCADSFTDLLQDLAIQTACIGQYSATQAGGGWYDDPFDYYTPDMMAERFKNMSGNMTRTTTFYGVCFDYAEFAYWDISTYQDMYVKAGMKEGQFFLAGVDSNSGIIELSSPTSQGSATKIQNGVPVKTYGAVSYRTINTHKNTKGIRAVSHAWIWIMRNDGVWFWVDPTWTDNLGYVVYGYVANGEEIQLRPDEKYNSPLLATYPDYLNALPLPPEWIKKEEEQKVENKTTNSTENINNNTSLLYEKDLFFNFGVIVPTTIFLGDAVNAGFELGLFLKKNNFFHIFVFDFMQGPWLVGYDIGYKQFYIGAGFGKNWNGTDFKDFAWKVNGGLKFQLSENLICLCEVSYSTILGIAGSVSIGF